MLVSESMVDRIKERFPTAKPSPQIRSLDEAVKLAATLRYTTKRDGAGWMAQSPQFPASESTGSTRKEALQNARNRAAQYLQYANPDLTVGQPGRRKRILAEIQALIAEAESAQP